METVATSLGSGSFLAATGLSAAQMRALEEVGIIRPRRTDCDWRTFGASDVAAALAWKAQRATDRARQAAERAERAEQRADQSRSAPMRQRAERARTAATHAAQSAEQIREEALAAERAAAA
jgi:DNA-binding transcriptional MerR regulator